MDNSKFYAIYLDQEGKSRITRGTAGVVRSDIYGSPWVKVLHEMKGGIPVKREPEVLTDADYMDGRRRCKYIAEELDAYHDGEVRTCPECGEIVQISHDGEKHKCPHCGEVSDVEDYDTLSLYDYLSDILDVTYTVEADRRTVRGVSILVAWGGPNIYIDTMDGDVKLYWGGTQARYPIRSDVRDALDDWAQEMFDC